MTTLISAPLTEALAPTQPDRGELGQLPRRHQPLRRLLGSSWLWLGMIAAAQAVCARVVPRNSGAFQDEGLYIYMGHRVLSQLSGGPPLLESPGSYFSGAPAFYPVLAALADSVGGLQGARDLSLACVVGAMVATYGLGRQLFGRLPGLLGAACLAACGPVIYLSQWATFDALTVLFGALAAWLVVYSARTEGLLRAPLVAMLLVAAVFAKYAGAMFVPVVAALAVAAGWERFGWRVVRRAVFLVAATVTMFFFVVLLLGRGLLAGLTQTTTERQVLNPTSAAELAARVALWVGPVLVLAVLGGVLAGRRRYGAVLVLLGGSVVGPLQQIHLGEATSLSKHVAFGLVFAAPLVGVLLAALARVRVLRRPGLLSPVVLGVLGGLLTQGLHDAGDFLTAYPDDAEFRGYLREAVAANPGRPVLGEQPSAQRYELRDLVAPGQWRDTYVFSYRGATGEDAYRQAISDHYFGVIYLNFTTPNAHVIIKYLGEAQGPDHYYHLVAQVPGYIHGQQAGSWLLWTPQTRHFTPIR